MAQEVRLLESRFADQYETKVRDELPSLPKQEVLAVIACAPPLSLLSTQH